MIPHSLGGHNRFFEMPSLLASLRDPVGRVHKHHLKRFATVLHIESWVLVGIIAVATVLVSSPLPGTE
jgi:putative copper resistance protein D